jgi:phage repressor protein C with HTH and peptisase S24 domain
MSIEIDATIFEKRTRQAIGNEPLKHWCARIGLPVSTLTGAFQRKSIPKADVLAQISMATGKSINWLLGLTQEAPVTSHPPGTAMIGETQSNYLIADYPEVPVAEGSARADWSEFIQVPVYAIKASLEHGAYVDRETVKSRLAFCRAFIRDRLLIAHNDLYCIEVEGIGMEPMLRNTHPALVDPADIVNLREGPYFLRLEGGLLLKNLQRMPGGNLRIWSENQSINVHPPIEVAWPPRAGIDFQILGRIRWSDIVF